MAKSDLDRFYAAANQWLTANCPEGLNFILIAHSEEQGRSRIVGNLDKDSIPMVLMGEATNPAAQTEEARPGV